MHFGSSVGQFAFWFRNRAVQRTGSFHPLSDDDLGIGDSFFVARAIGNAARQFRHLDQKGMILLAPVNDEFVSHVSRFQVDTSA